MSTRRLKWSPQFRRDYQKLQDDAVRQLKSGDGRLLKRFLQVGETYKILASCPGPPEGDRRLDTHSYVEASRRALAERMVFGSRILAEGADFRVFWRPSQDEDDCLILVKLGYPCM